VANTGSDAEDNEQTYNKQVSGTFVSNQMNSTKQAPSSMAESQWQKQSKKQQMQGFLSKTSLGFNHQKRRHVSVAKVPPSQLRIQAQDENDHFLKNQSPHNDFVWRETHNLTAMNHGGNNHMNFLHLDTANDSSKFASTNDQFMPFI
jgi:hypothetical protein